MHTSGQWISGEIPLACDSEKPQILGSWIAYARRYALAAIAGVVSEGDDAEAASRPARREQATKAPPPELERKPKGPRTTWSQWIGPFLSQFLAEWQVEMREEGIPPETAADWVDLSSEPQEVNALCSRLVELGRLDAKAIAKDGSPDLRDPDKARAHVVLLFERSPNVVMDAVRKRLQKKRLEARKLLLSAPVAVEEAL